MSTPTPTQPRANAAAVSTRPSPQPRSRIRWWGSMSVVARHEVGDRRYRLAKSSQSLSVFVYPAAPGMWPRPLAWWGGKGSACAARHRSVAGEEADRIEVLPCCRIQPSTHPNRRRRRTYLLGLVDALLEMPILQCLFLACVLGWVGKFIAARGQGGGFGCSPSVSAWCRPTKAWIVASSCSCCGVVSTMLPGAECWCLAFLLGVHTHMVHNHNWPRRRSSTHACGIIYQRTINGNGSTSLGHHTVMHFFLAQLATGGRMHDAMYPRSQATVPLAYCHALWRAGSVSRPPSD